MAKFYRWLENKLFKRPTYLIDIYIFGILPLWITSNIVFKNWFGLALAIPMGLFVFSVRILLSKGDLMRIKGNRWIVRYVRVGPNGLEFCNKLWVGDLNTAPDIEGWKQFEYAAISPLAYDCIKDHWGI